VKKFLAMFIVAGVLMAGVVGCGDDKKPAPKPAEKAADKADKK